MLLSPRLASGRQPPIILTSSRLVPIHQIGMLCCRARFGILCVEALPERSNHFREPVHFPVIVLSAHAPQGKTFSQSDRSYQNTFNPFRTTFPQAYPAKIASESPSRTSKMVWKNCHDWGASVREMTLDRVVAGVNWARGAYVR